MPAPPRKPGRSTGNVAKTRVVWTIRDAGGYPAPQTSEGKRAQPFWSSRAGAEKIIETVPAYAGFEPHEVTWDDFCSRWVPGLARDGLLVGVNWSGKRATGYDLEPERLREYVEAGHGEAAVSASCAPPVETARARVDVTSPAAPRRTRFGYDQRRCQAWISANPRWSPTTSAVA